MGSRTVLTAGMAAVLAVACTTVAGLDELSFGVGGDSAAGGAGSGASGGSSGASCGADLMSDPDNCGSCGTTCEDGDHGSRACIDGACGFDCNGGFGDCDERLDNGCEATIDSDDENCGSCGRSCGGSTCNAGVCAPLLLASGQGGPEDIEFRNGYAYWVNHQDGSLMRCPSGGCPNGPELVGANGYWAFYLAVDDTHVYWNNNANDEIWKCPITGCPMGTTAWISNVSNPTQLGADDTRVCWHSNDAVLHCVNKDGTGLAQVITGVGNGGEIIPAGSNLYWTDRSLNEIKRCKLSDCPGTVEVMASSQTRSVSLDLDATHAYWGTDDGSMSVVARIPLAGGSVEVIASGQTDVSDVGVNDTHVYFLNRVSSSGSLKRVAKDGSGSIEILAQGLDEPARLALGDGYVFVTTRAGNEVWRYPQ